MPIIIKRVEGKYVAEVTPPDSQDVWRTGEPLEFDDLYQQLQDRGCHAVDVADAFIDADPSTRARFGVSD